MRLIHRFLAAAMTALLAVSCMGDTALIYNFSTIGNFKDKVFTTDDGYILNVTKVNVDGVIDTLDRCIILCDLLTQNGDKSYDICLNGYTPVTVINALDKSTATDDQLGMDAVNVEQAWYSGHCLNILFATDYLIGSKTKHQVSILFDREKSIADTLYFEARHNAFGESYRNEAYTIDGIGIEEKYLSVPLDGLYDREKANNLKLKLSWNWYDKDPEDSGAYLRTTSPQDGFIDLKR